MRLTPTLFAIATAPVIVITATLGVLFVQLEQAEQNRKQESAARQALDNSLRMTHAVGRCGFTMFRYTTDLDPKWLWQFRSVEEQLPDTLNQIDDVCHSPASREAAKRMASQLGKILAQSHEIIWSAQLSPNDLCPIRVNELRSGLHPSMRKLTEYTDDLAREVEADLARHEKRSDTLEQQRLFVVLGLLGAGLSTVAMVAFFNRRILDRLETVSANTEKLAKGEALSSPLSGSDEIVDLDRTFHAMALSLEEARKRETDAVKNSADVIVVFSDQQRILEVNEAVREWGFEPMELLNQPLETFVGDIKSLADNHTEVQIGDRIGLLTMQRSPSGARSFCVIHDITERKRLEKLISESEVRETLIFESVPTSVLVLEPNGTILRANAVAKGFLEKLGNPDVLFPQQLKDAGMPIDVSVDVLPGGLQLVVLLDLAERKQLEESKQALLKMISEDIDAPLTKISETLSQIKESNSRALNETGSKKVTAAGVESRRLMRLFRDLLHAESSGRFQINKHCCSLNGTIRGAIDAVSSMAERAGVAVEQIDDAEIDIDMDQQRIVQMLVNLLTNAIKFSKSGDPITVRASASAAAASIEVVDQGRGIPDEVLPTIFDAFVQAKKSDASEKGGTGLGLAICKTIVEAQSGTLEVTNNAHAGCTFKVVLPR